MSATLSGVYDKTWIVVATLLLVRSHCSDLTGGRVRQGNLSRLFLKPGEKGAKFLGDVREGLSAGRVGSAALENQVQRMLRIGGVFGSQFPIYWRHAVQRDRPGMLGILALVGLGHPRAIGNPDQVHFLVTQRGANLIQILHGSRGRIQTRVGSNFGDTAFEVFDLLLRGCYRRRFSRFRRGRAAQRVGLPRPALIDHHNSAVLVQAFQNRGERWEGFGSGLPGATRKQEKRVWLGVFADRWNNRDIQVDFPACLLGLILIDRKDPAARGDTALHPGTA